MKKDYFPLKLTTKSKGRRIAIGDIHGCYKPLYKLLDEKLKITKYDQVFLLGDLVDRGKQSSLVLDTVFDLINDGYELYPIKGNHEEKILSAYNCGFDFFESYLAEYNSADLLDGDLEKYLEFISNFHYCIELDRFILSHAGINENRINPFTDLRGMFSNINFIFNEKEYIDKIQVHGHIVRTIDQIRNHVQGREKRFSIDSGCYIKSNELGFLTALDLDSMELYHQKNN